MNCEHFKDSLDDWLGNQLPSSELKEFWAHLDACPHCREEAQFAQEMLTALQTLPNPVVPAGLAERVLGTRPRQQRSSHWAIAASLTIAILGGLYTLNLDNNPLATSEDAQQWVSLSLTETREVMLSLAAAEEIENAQLTLELPAGVELQGYPQQHELRWTASLQKGENRLKLPLLASSNNAGELVLRIEHGDKKRILRIGVRTEKDSRSTEAPKFDARGITA